MTEETCSSSADELLLLPPKSSSRPLRIGVFGGSFNPIHLGHALLAITTQQTKPVDQVVLVPVYKHAVKRDLLPFDDRVQMCQLAVAPFSSDNRIVVSRVEERVGASNGVMLKGLKDEYPTGTQFLYICGDDFFRWMEKPKGLETLEQVDGLIVQRRLHKHDNNDRFFKEPFDEQRVRAVAARLNLTIDFIYGELPHFSSTLVRRAPGHWRSFLPQTVATYLEQRPHLLEILIHNLEVDSEKEMQQSQSTNNNEKQHESSPSHSSTSTDGAETSIQKINNQTTTAAEWVIRGLNMVHALQLERGRSGLLLSLGTSQAAQDLNGVQTKTDDIIQQVLQDTTLTALKDTAGSFQEEVMGLALELQQVPVWLKRDRSVLKQRCGSLVHRKGIEGWLARAALVEKFNPRIDVLRLSLLRALTEIRNHNNNNSDQDNTDDRDLMPELLWKWSQAKEALGRQRAFVCAGGPNAPFMIVQSMEMRQRLNECIQEKDRSIARVLSLVNEQQQQSTPDALHRLLENVTWWEWKLMRSFAPSTPLSLVHKLLSKTIIPTDSSSHPQEQFHVEKFFDASTTAIDFLLTFTKALAASACAG
ncbi:Probable nicotinate-nucleotide adenylyltransferase [Seminavis robusta]|uniref:Probable nicotinate-nucleotide adenylyltransferase n=1 Tax=Seminavis robusta TaxID=568900 RepID=A0A9N8DDD8_9STRA|nr:Probable nicotinate-nucleotide adenylyltransferase [Seminavis robusta]|eukprot:Sro68_g037870.1 Probable nicotinate-nucleotide adenylyltransferase (589) ;mRNA; f:8733-10499